MSDIYGVQFTPIVYPEEAADFEKFALEYYDHEPNIDAEKC
jgi:hypothetical protein